MKKLITFQFVVLLGGTLFAWYNFAQEMLVWLGKKTIENGCTAGIVNPFLTPCFYGAIFFTLAFVLSAAILKKSK